MSGIKYLLDTNVFLGVLQKYDPAMSLVENLNFDQCGFSVVTRMELLGYPSIPAQESKQIAELLSYLTRFTLDNTVENQVIEIRQQHKIKLPDAIICTTAIVNDLQLMTLDKKLMRVYEQC